MKIALVGYGKMGRLIHTIAESRHHSIIAAIDLTTPLDDAETQKKVKTADVCIDFSTPQAVLKNVEILSSLKKNIVVGTTGWENHLPEIEQIVKQSGIGFLHSPNFSLGIAIFLKILAETAKVMSNFPQYDVAGMEIHHRKKIDAPSGTAKAIETKINPHLPTPIVFSSMRVGNVPGTHSVIYDSPVDTITLTHAARNREGFAEGAVQAAEWLLNKKGMFTLDDLMASIKED